MNATLFASLVFRFVVRADWAPLEIRNKCGAWFLMRRHLEYSKQISSSTNRPKKKKKSNGRLFYAHICHSQDHIRVDIIHSNIRRWAHTLSRHQTNVCRRRQRHHPKLTELTPRICCWYLHTCVVHLTFLSVCVLSLLCVFCSALGRLEKKIRGSKREATQTSCLMRYLQMLWRVETMLEICSEFVPLCRFLNSHITNFLCKYFCRRLKLGRHRLIYKSPCRFSIYLFACCLNGFGWKRWAAYLKW